MKSPEELMPSMERAFPVFCVRRWISAVRHRIYLFVGTKHTPEIRKEIDLAEKRQDYWSKELGKLCGMSKRPSPDVSFVFGTVWPEDDVTYALTKIRMYIERAEEPKKDLEQVIPFAWKDQGILRFDWPTIEVDTTNLNPWSKPFSSIVKRQPKYHPYEQIGSHDINLVLYDDLSIKKAEDELHMYFPDREQTRKLFSSRWIQKTEDYLNDVWSAPAVSLRDTAIQLKEVMWEAHVPELANKISLAELYESTNATERTPLIQWCDDVTRVLYKLYKEHHVRADHLKKWTNRYNIPKVPSVLLYDVWNSTNTYTRTHIQEDGKIMITYNISTNDKTFHTLEDIRKHASDVVARIQKMIRVSNISLSLADISYSTTFRISMLNLPKDRLLREIHDDILYAIPLFHMEGRVDKKQELFLVFKKASTLEHRYPLSEVIQSLLEHGITLLAVKKHLTNMGYEEDVINMAVEEVAHAQHEGKAIRSGLRLDIDPIMVVTFKDVDGMFDLGVRHAPNVEEAKRAIQWLASVIFHTREKIHKVSVIESTSPPPAVAPIPEEKEEEKKAEETISHKRTESDEDFTFHISGGVDDRSKKGQGYLLKRLKKVNATLYGENYARKCQSERQPLVMNQEEWNRSKTKMANSIRYHGQYYGCPSLWCPDAGMAITYEELDKNGKCPGNGEDPMIFLEKEQHTGKGRFIGFIDTVVVLEDKQVYAPCCYRNDRFAKRKAELIGTEDLVVYKGDGEPIQVTQREAEPVKVKKEETYIHTKKGPVPGEEGRYGDVPLALYQFLFPKYKSRSQSISKDPTIVRHGIGTVKDTLMNSIAYALGMENKQDLIKKMIEQLDPLSFISLEGGAVLAAFSNDGVPQISYSSWKIWVDQYPSYKTYLGLQEHEPGDLRIVREIKIYEAYLRFIHHLESEDEKNTSMLYHLLTKFGVFLMIWEQDLSKNTIRLSCPYFMGYEHMKEIIHQFENRYIMLLHNTYEGKGYYEPLEIRTLHDHPLREIPITSYPMIDHLTAKCPVAYVEREFDAIEALRGLIHWTYQFAPVNFRPYMPEQIILSADLHIEALITYGNHWIQLPRLSLQLLPYLVQMLNGIGVVAKIRYHEDLDTGSISSRVPDQNWRGKCESLGFVVLEHAPPPSPVAPVVSVMHSIHQEKFDNIQKDLRDWRDIQLRIAKYLLYQYDMKVAPHKGLSRKDFISKILGVVLSDLWKEETASKKIPYAIRKKVKTTIEEMPLIYGKDSLQRWIHAITLLPYRFYDSEVYTSETDKKNWTFSQLAIEMGLPNGVFVPTAAAVPEPNTVPEVYDVQPVTPETPVAEVFPQMARTENVSEDLMPSKWRKMMLLLLRVKEYKREYIPDLVQWIVKKIHSPFRWSDIVRIRYLQIARSIDLSKEEFMNVMRSYIQEFSFKQELIRVFDLNKSIKETELLNTLWNQKGVLSQKLSTVQSDAIFPMDIDLQITAQLLDMFVLIIFRRPYKAEDVEQGEMKDLTVSSLLYSNPLTTMDRPLIMLYREKDDTKSENNIYNLIITKAKKVFYFSSASSSPDPIQEILYAHRNKKK